MKTREIEFAVGSLAIEGISDEDPYLPSIGAGGFKNLIQFFQKFSQDTSNMVDVGANIGITAGLASKIVPDGKILAIEAGAANYQALLKNIAANDLGNVTPVLCAAGEDDGTTRMLEDSAWGHRVDDSPWPGTADSGTAIPLCRVDTLLRQHAMATADLIKIDTEGWEIEVTRGFGEAARDAVVFLEFNSWCLVGLRNVKPLDTLRELRQRFAYLYYFDDGSITRLTDRNEMHFLHRNLVVNKCCEDLIAANRELSW